MKPNLKRILSGMLSIVVAISAVPSVSTYADEVMIISVDQKHKGSDIYAQLWINDEGLVMATPFLYEKDSVKIVRRSSVFKYDVMLELPCSDIINLDQSFIELFNRIYEKDLH